MGIFCTPIIQTPAFDISHVFRPADRIAYVSGKLQKAASAGECVSGAELAEQMGVTLPVSLLANELTSKRAQAQLQVLQLLADTERTLNLRELTKAAAYTPTGLAAAIQQPVDFDGAGSVKLAELLRGLADSAVILPVRDFLMLTIKQADAGLVNAVSSATISIFDRLMNEPNIASTLENNVYFPADAAPPPVRLWAEKVACTYSVLEDRLQKQAYTAALRGATPRHLVEKTASATSAINALAKHYALYKIAALTAVTEKYGNNLLTVGHCILQNYIT